MKMEMVTEVPLFYKWVIELIDPHCNLDEIIEVRHVRRLISMRFKLGKQLVSPLLIEMKDMGLIEYYEIDKIKVLYKPQLVVQ